MIETFVIAVKDIAHRTVEIQIGVPDDFTFQAGQYVTLTLPELDDYPIKEQFHDFSIASAPSEKGLIRVVFRMSDSLYKQAILSNGAKLQLEGPQGIFTLPTNQKIIAVAGGIGITPFMSMLKGGNQKFDLVYYNTKPESAVYMHELEQLLGNRLNAFYGDPLLAQLSQLHIQNPLHQWYIAGSPRMVANVRKLLKTLLVDDTMIRTEEFSGYETHN